MMYGAEVKCEECGVLGKLVSSNKELLDDALAGAFLQHNTGIHGRGQEYVHFETEELRG